MVSYHNTTRLYNAEGQESSPPWKPQNLLWVYQTCIK